MGIVIKGARILNPAFDIIEGNIYIEGNKITKVADGVVDGAHRVIDGAGRLAIPAFKNCHAHSAMTLLRGLAEDLPLMEWLQSAVFPIENKMDEEAVYWGTQLAILEYVRNGIAAAADMYFHLDAVRAAARDSGFRVACVNSCADMNEGYQDREKTKKSLKLMQDSMELADDEYVTNLYGIHAEYTVSDQLLEGISQLAAQFNKPMWAHASETKGEVASCLERHNKSPIQRLVDGKLFESSGGVYHCVYPLANDLSIIFDKKLTVVTNPASNLKLACGIAPITKFIERGISVALGTDGAASNNALDFFRELCLLASLQKAMSGDAAAIMVKQALSIAFNNCAKVFGAPSKIEQGFAADIVLLDLSCPNLNPQHNLAASLVYAANPSNVALTMVNGKVLYDSGKYFLRHSPQEIYSRVSRINKNLLQK